MLHTNSPHDRSGVKPPFARASTGLERSVQVSILRPRGLPVASTDHELLVRTVSVRGARREAPVRL